MKIYFLLLVISILYEINCRCMANEGEIEDPEPEDCFRRTVEEAELPDVVDGNVNDYQCCYAQQNEFNAQRHCWALKSSDITGDMSSAFYAIGCSPEQLPEELRIPHCFIYEPINQNSCFSRTLSDSEKTEAGGFTPNKCCYLEYHSIMKVCYPADDSNLNEYIQWFREQMGANSDDLNFICQEASTTPDPGSGVSTDNGANGNNPGSGGSTDNGVNAQKSNTSQFSRNNKLVLMMFLMLLSI